MKSSQLLLSMLALWTGAALAGGVDPLTADIDARDALRFAALMKDGAVPTADALQRGYLDGAGAGVKIFMPAPRIGDAHNLAQAVAKRPDTYRYAIRECLPRLPALRADLRAIYLGFAGLLPERPLPAIHVIFGALSSGGTASNDAQVIGLEVTCPPGTTPEQFRTTMRGFFAHEAVHTWQDDETPAALADLLLSQALREGVADYLATLVTGAIPHQERDAWARPQEATLWQAFQRDRLAIKGNPAGMAKIIAMPQFRRWFANCKAPPDGWPCEAGYWIGMRIAEAYVAQAPDKRAAIRELIELRNPAAILEASRYGM